MSDLEVQARTALRKGAEYIAENGHYKKGFFPPDGRTFEDKIAEGYPACALGAVFATRGQMDDVFHLAREILLASLDGYETIGDWNDEEDRIAEEVILQMKRVGNE